MASEIDICNSALVRLGASTISAFTDGTVEAELCDQVFERVRNTVLTIHPWNFAIKRTALPSLSEKPAWGYGHSHQLPSDCLRLLNTQDQNTDFKVEGGLVLSNTSPLYIRYISKITTTGLYSPQFRDVLEKKLAVELSFTLVQSTSLQEQLLKEYNLALADARSFDAQEGSPEDNINDVFLDARYGLSYE